MARTTVLYATLYPSMEGLTTLAEQRGARCACAVLWCDALRCVALCWAFGYSRYSTVLTAYSTFTYCFLVQ
jgi:hypothetical protein